MNTTVKTLLTLAAVAIAVPAAALVTFYEREGFAGRSFTTSKQVGNFDRQGFNDRASSVVVAGERWDHRVQLTNPPGATVTVNRNGEPRA